MNINLNPKIMKLLTEKVLNEKFIEKYGIHPDDAPDTERAILTLQDYYDFNIVETYDNNANFYIYEESTADGYSVYVATHNQNSICVSEEIHYYSSKLHELVEEVLYAGDTLAIDQDENYFEEAIDSMYPAFVVEALDHLKTDLLNEGYIEAIDDPESSLGLLEMVYQKMKATESNEYLFGIPEQLPDSSTSDIKLIKFYTQICLDVNSFRKYARKVLNCNLSITGNNTIKLTIIPVI